MLLKLNLGCGANKIKGYVNIDVEDSVKPDLKHDFTKAPLPYEDGTVDEVIMFHTIEHISKRFHNAILGEVWRVLKKGAKFYCSFPEFIKCVENWKTNAGGAREFWEATIYGRQDYPSDYHVCIMDSAHFKILLESHSFEEVGICAEPTQPFNSVVYCIKGEKLPTYEQLIKRDMEALVLL